MGFVALCHHHAVATLDRQLLPTLKHREGQDTVLHLLHGAVRVGDGVAIEQDAGRRAGGADQIPGLGKIGGIAVIIGKCAGNQRRADGVPDVGVVRARKIQRFVFEAGAAPLRHPRLGHIQPGVGGEKRLAVAGELRGLGVGPVVVFLRRLRQTLEGGEAVDTDPGFGGEAVEQGLVQVEDFCGLGDGEHIQPILKPPLLHKGWYVSRQILLSEVIVQVGKHSVFLEQDRRLGIAGGDVWHLRCTGVSRRDHVQGLLQLGAGADGRHVDDDALLLAHRAVELVDQRIHRVLHTAAEVVPHGERHRLLGIEGSVPAARAAGQRQG